MYNSYIFCKDYNKKYYDDFSQYYVSVMYPGALRAKDLINQEDDA